MVSAKAEYQKLVDRAGRIGKELEVNQREWNTFMTDFHEWAQRHRIRLERSQDTHPPTGGGRTGGTTKVVCPHKKTQGTNTCLLDHVNQGPDGTYTCVYDCFDPKDLV